MPVNCKCSVPGCKSTEKFFKFPSKDMIGLQWLQAINNPTLGKMSYKDILKKQYRVCSLHFQKNEIRTLSNKTILQTDSIPSLLLPNKLDSTSLISNKFTPDSSIIKSEPPVISYSSSAELQKTKRRCKNLQTKNQELRQKLKNEINAQYYSKIEKLSNVQRCFISMMLRNANREMKSRRYTKDESLLCLSIYKKSPSCYAYLRSLFPLPCESRLKQIRQKTDVDCEINKTIKEEPMWDTSFSNQALVDQFDQSQSINETLENKCLQMDLIKQENIC